MIELKNFRLIELPRIVDGKDGVISVAESSKQIPFDIKRVYYIYGLDSSLSIRGMHAHKELEQVLLCVHGSVVIDLDDGFNKDRVHLDEPNHGIYLGPRLWHVMTGFSEDCVLLVLASDLYKESDYIRDYDAFLTFVREGR